MHLAILPPSHLLHMFTQVRNVRPIDRLSLHWPKSNPMANTCDKAPQNILAYFWKDEQMAEQSGEASTSLKTVWNDSWKVQTNRNQLKSTGRCKRTSRSDFLISYCCKGCQNGPHTPQSLSFNCEMVYRRLMYSTRCPSQVMILESTCLSDYMYMQKLRYLTWFSWRAEKFDW